MENLISVLPVSANRNIIDFSDAEEVVVSSVPTVVEPIKVARPKKVNHFIEANTEEVIMDHLRYDCVTPVFSKDNELTISHPMFIDTIEEAARSFFSGEQVCSPEVRTSHVVKGRIPEAITKPASQLLESDKTIYYERCAFSIDIPSIYQDVNGNRLNLSIVGVRAYNQMNLYSRKSPELFRLAIGFKNNVCCNMCIFTDGYNADLRVMTVEELHKQALYLFHNFNPAMQIHLMQQLGETTMTEHQFCQVLGKMRLYQSLPSKVQKDLPNLLITDTQINNVAKCYISDDNFSGYQDHEINMWKFYNLLTGANKSSYIDSFLDRGLNATETALGINSALRGDERYRWFID